MTAPDLAEAFEHLVAAACSGPPDVDAFAGILHDTDPSSKLPPLQSDHRGVWHAAPATCAWAPAAPPWSRVDGWDASTGRPCLSCLVSDEDGDRPVGRPTLLRAVFRRATRLDPRRDLRPWRILDALVDVEAATCGDRSDAPLVRRLRVELRRRLADVPGDAVVAAAVAWLSDGEVDRSVRSTARQLLTAAADHRLVAAVLVPSSEMDAALPTFGPLRVWRGHGIRRAGVHVLAVGPGVLADVPGVTDLGQGPGTDGTGVVVAAGQLWAAAEDATLYADPRAAWEAARLLAGRGHAP